MTYETVILVIVVLTVVIFSLVFLLLSKKISRINEDSKVALSEHRQIIDGQSKIHLTVESGQKSYNEIAAKSGEKLKEINESISGISSVISSVLVPKLEDVYKRIDYETNLVSIERLTEFYKTQGVELVRMSEESAFFGVKEGDLNVTVIFFHRPQKSFIDIMTFSSVLTDPSPEFLEKLLVFNEKITVGKIGLRTYDGKSLLIVGQGLFLSQNKIDYNVLDRTVSVLISVHSDIDQMIKEKQIVFQVILITDFLRLELGEEEYQRMFSSDKDSQEKTEQEEKA